ncbi:MAG: putative dual-specificity RNA methyltransferase RlmN [Verrucomicrobiae bacterium]|nr:putative dual-specificity RNA methyltransferase RlmN [Verrucomicrobiae bacterium]
MTAKPDIKSLYRDELAKLCDQPYRADQVLQWVYQKNADSFAGMSNMPAALREQLAAQFELNAVHSVHTRNASDTTEKFLFQLRDRSLIETVLIPATPGLTTQSDRHTVCISTQVGCAYGCKFCASGLEGVKRNLTAAEIVDQVVHVQRLSGERVSNIVVMGMGEPLANYDNVLRALRIINAGWALGIGARKMTISTVGLAPRIRQLADEPMQIRLAISLHGATDDVRSQIMPVNKKHPLQELLDACDYYVNTRQRILTFEYILIEGVNDSLDQAHKLGAIARRLRAKVNLIPYNPVDGLQWRRPGRDRCKMFAHTLKSHGITATLRTEKGTDINAACGQLRLQRQNVGMPEHTVADQ